MPDRAKTIEDLRFILGYYGVEDFIVTMYGKNESKSVSVYSTLMKAIDLLQMDARMEDDLK